MGKRQSAKLFQSPSIDDLDVMDVSPHSHLKVVRTSKKQKYPQPIKSAIWFKDKLIPKTVGQEFYINAINESVITLCQGPAGCGKSWIVTRLALEALAENRVSQIIISKPIVEAGDEEIGFLPGDMNDKILPYFFSILDCIEDHIGPAKAKELIDSEKIKFVPTAFMRGRDIKNSFILIDEAQNLTKKGIKLLTTRLSSGSKIVLNGDAHQDDLPKHKESGFEWAMNKLHGKHADISVIKLSRADQVRHPLLDVLIDNLYE